MKFLSKANQTWTLKPTKDDLIRGARYAAITLPWTFNRMMKNVSPNGQRERALNIAKGIVGQAVLRRALSAGGVKAQVQNKSHRDEDLFDFRVQRGGRQVTLDVKTLHHFTNYPNDQRAPFSTNLVLQHAAYDGPDWRQFFPMLVPHTQIGQDKEAYCFAIASSIDPRKDVHAERAAYAITAFPHGEVMPFFGNKRLVIGREEAGKGIFVTVEYIGEGLFQASTKLTLIGEWKGEPKEVEITLAPGKAVKDVGPFSCISSFQMGKKEYDLFSGKIEIHVGRNEFKTQIRNSAMQDVNVVPDVVLVLEKANFTNLVLPNDYTVNFLGWTDKSDFLQACLKYRSWIWPSDAINRFHNQPWSQLTDKDRKTLQRLGWEDRIQSGSHRVGAGFMKTSPGGGACCYVYPNIAFGGGLRETNLYALPADLQIMGELGR